MHPGIPVLEFLCVLRTFLASQDAESGIPENPDIGKVFIEKSQALHGDSQCNFTTKFLVQLSFPIVYLSKLADSSLAYRGNTKKGKFDLKLSVCQSTENMSKGLFLRPDGG